MKPIPLKSMPMLTLAAVMTLGLMGLALSACGVRQFNSAKKTERPTSTQGYGPFYANAQNSQGMEPSGGVAGCNNTGRPCVRARASVGLPYQFEENQNNQTNPAPPADAAAGKIRAPAGPGAPRAENRDLFIMERQAQ